MIPHVYKSLTWTLACFAIGTLGLVSLIVLLLILDPTAPTRHERIDTLSPGPYVVETVHHGRTVYLVETTTDGGASDKPDWSPLIEQATRFASEEEANVRALRVGGLMVQLRSVSP